MTWAPPPRDEAELRRRADLLAGRSLGEIARALGQIAPEGGLHGKGKLGELVERALGASAGNTDVPDFPHLGIELKTIPIDPSGVPRESTFVCAISLVDAERVDWETSRARAKLAHVLWVPIVTTKGAPAADRIVRAPILWKPTPEQERLLRDDFDELMGTIGLGGIEGVTAHAGRALQVRPKAASGRERTVAFGADGERIATVPRGFYLRARFTATLLRDPLALPSDSPSPPGGEGAGG